MLTPLCRHFGYLRTMRTLVQPPDKLLQLLPITLGLDFNPSIEQVPHASAQAKSSCLLKDKPPVEHALDHAGNRRMQRRGVRLVCHE